MILIGMLMHLYCDADDCLASAEFKGLEQIDLHTAAMRAGWTIRVSDRMCFCPEHASQAERRS
jgi:hypothetical protein